MKIKNIAAICKKNKYAVIYERYGESGGVIQYIGDGAAAYPVSSTFRKNSGKIGSFK